MACYCITGNRAGYYPLLFEMTEQCWVEKQRARVREYQRVWRIKHRETYNARMNKYYHDHKDAVLRKQAEWRKDRRQKKTDLAQTTPEELINS